MSGIPEVEIPLPPPSVARASSACAVRRALTAGVCRSRQVFASPPARTRVRDRSPPRPPARTRARTHACPPANHEAHRACARSPAPATPGGARARGVMKPASSVPVPACLLQRRVQARASDNRVDITAVRRAHTTLPSLSLAVTALADRRLEPIRSEGALRRRASLCQVHQAHSHGCDTAPPPPPPSSALHPSGARLADSFPPRPGAVVQVAEFYFHSEHFTCAGRYVKLSRLPPLAR
jgi:hypothetical protein